VAESPPASWRSWLLAGAGFAGLAAAFALRPADAASAAAQDWSPFVLVSGLLLIGLVADGDGLFAAAGARLAATARQGWLLYAGSVVLVGGVTAVLNLDTSVAFLTPVLVHTARHRGSGEPALLYGCLLLSNAGSLLLPGSNLTNLIVLGHLHLTGGQFAGRMWLPWVGALLVTAAVVALLEWRSLRPAGAEPGTIPRPVIGLGLAAIAAVTVLVIATRSAALPVLVVGIVVTAIRMARPEPGRPSVPRRLGTVWQVLDPPVLAGLFGVSVALGTLGRAWSGPAVLLGHLSGWATAAFAAVATVLVNNLPAASLLAARTPGHPFELLLGLNLGPNLCVTGSLAWLLWLRAARSAGATPSLSHASRLGVLAVPAALAVALAGLALTGGS
jgi:arsenical pump membrane protein